MIAPIVEQAPCSFAGGSVPASASSCAPIGTMVQSRSGTAYFRRYDGRILPVDPVTGKPVYPAPVSAGPHCDHVSTTSKQSGNNPAPIPPVGTVSPKVSYSCVDAPSVAPATSSGSVSGLALFAGAIVLLWILAGVGLRRFL